MSTGGSDGATGNPQLVLGPTEDVVPEAGFKVIFQLGQVEVRPADAVQLPSRALVEVEPEVDQAPRHGLSVHQNVALRKMPSARPHDDCRYVFAQTVFLAGPVISTPRSSKPGAWGATRQSASARMCLVSARKSGSSPAAIRPRRSSRSATRSRRRSSNASCKPPRKFSASGVRTWS
jgi:hypothetical protein